MFLTAFFTENFAPKAGLSPAITILRLRGNTTIVSAQAMVETALTGYYYYNFTTYDSDDDYVITVDGGAILTGSERYKFGSLGEVNTINIANEVWAHKSGEFIKNIEGGRWKVDTVLNQMIFYEPDNVTEVARFNLYGYTGLPAHEDVYERKRAGFVTTTTTTTTTTSTSTTTVT